MLDNEKISNRQFTILVFLYIIGSSILISPSGLAMQAKQDAWMAAILGTVIGLLLIPIYSKLGQMFPNMTLTEYSEKIMGRWIGKAVSLLFFSYPFLICALVLRNIGDFITTHIMVETPIQAVHILFLCIVIMAVRLGLEVFSRAAEIFFPWIVMLIIFILCALFPQVEWMKTEPMLEEGIMPIVQASFPLLGTSFWQLSIFLMIFPYVKRTKDTGKAMLIGSMIGGGVLIIITALCILVLGAHMTAMHIYPTFTLAKKINVGDFLERMESIIAGIWFLTIFFKLSICYYASLLALKQILKLKEYKPLVLPFGMIIITLSIVVYPNIPYYLNFSSQAWIPYSLLCGVILPLLLLIVAVIRKRIN